MHKLLNFFHLPEALALKVGDPAPLFELATHQGELFNLATRQHQGWTVLFFYPKAGTPVCTQQVCSFRDDVSLLHAVNADVYGISTDSVQAITDFHRKHQLNYTLLADNDAKVTEAYGAKMPMLKLAKRWTFILDTDLIIRHIDNQVDANFDCKNAADRIKRFFS